MEARAMTKTQQNDRLEKKGRIFSSKANCKSLV